MNTKPISFSDFQIAYLLGLKDAISKDKKTGQIRKLNWNEITEKYNRKFLKEQKSKTALQQAEHKYKNLFKEDDYYVKGLKDSHSAKRRNSYTARQNKELLNYLEKKGDILDGLSEIIKNIKPRKFKFPKISKNQKKKNMTVELILSDIHYGKKTDDFDLAICQNRIRYLASTTIKEIKRNQKLYNVERIILAILGDIIESSTMHGVESAIGCEFGTSRQCWESVDSLFNDIIIPLAMLGIPISVPCVTGNHDRTEAKKTYHYPGESNVTFFIYKTLEALCKRSGFKHIKFDIPKGPYTTLEVYGNVILYEHYDNAKACTRNALEALMKNRATQLSQHVSYMRGGHFHEVTMFGLGKIIANGSVCGQDSYAEILGFDTAPCQVLNFYVKSDRPYSFYRTFPIYMK